jgi:hypothetical protein
MFLEILGVIFLIVLLVVGYYGWKIYRFAKKHANSDIATALSVLPTQEIEFEPSSVQEWKEQERLKSTESDLRKIGAEPIGYYCIYDGYSIIRLSMWNFKSMAVVALYEVSSELEPDNVMFIQEVAGKLTNGSLCITSNSNASFDSRPSNHKVVFNESQSIVNFLKSLKIELPEGSKFLKIKDGKAFFEECYEDTVEWGWMESQLRSNKTQQVLTSVGVTITDELMEELIEIGETYSVDLNVERARKKLARHSKMTADQWEKIRDKLIFINEKMKADQVMDAIYELLGEPSEMQEEILEGFEKTSSELVDPIAAFQMLVQTMNLKVKRLSQMDEPVRTEVYLPK